MQHAPEPTRKRAPVRRDPPKTHRGTENGMFGVTNKDPKRHYVWANRDDVSTGLQHYLAMGYEVVESSADGAKAVRNSRLKPGEEVSMKEMVLVSIQREEHERIQREGAWGDGGQEQADRIQNALFKGRRARGHRDREMPDGITGFVDSTELDR